jgi:hypothetical protein
MKVRRLLLILGFLISSNTWSADKPTPLILEGNTTLRVGELAVLEIPQDRHYHGNTGAGNVLALIRNSIRTTLYRAVRPGQQTILMGSAEIPKGECVSCTTLHYFITVVPKK